jgi:alkylation response protein AidB-like acyl-CoA dehydrogenase
MTGKTTKEAASSDLEQYRKKVRAWLETNLDKRPPGETAPRNFAAGHRSADGIAKEREIQRKLYDGGYSGISWPTTYGGQGLTTAHERVFNEEALTFRTPDFGAAGGTTFGVCGRTMLIHASPEFLARHIPKILAGKELWVQFFSEPNAGSDLAGVVTRAERNGDRWILNGSKIWSSSAYFADYGMCLARTDWDVPKHRGLTWFAVRIDKPGVTVQPIRQINGSAEFCQEYFDDVELEANDVIGEVNQGWSVAQTMLVLERGGGDRGAVIATERAARRTLVPDLVALAKRLGREKDPHVRQLIGRAQVNDFVQAELASRLVRLGAGAANAGGIASYGKLAAGTFVAARARIGIEIGRGVALVWDEGDTDGMSISQSYLNGRARGIAGGTNEMQRNAIGEQVLGLPREPSFDSDRPFSEVVRNAIGWTGKLS